MIASTAAAPRPFPGRYLLAFGLGLTALGIIAYAMQLSMGSLIAPWYVPIASSLGVVLIAFSLRQAYSIWRVLALVLVVLFTAFEWAFMVAAQLPTYTGPVAAGKAFPEFTTTRADGTPFTQRDLQGDQNQVLVFFRGRW